MYVKLFSHMLDSSIANNRKLRHFFTDLLLCADPDGNVMMTKESIAARIRTSLSEVEWGIKELLKPDPTSNHPEMEGRRIIALEGHGYGWQIVNYKLYRDMKSAAQMRLESAERVRKHRKNKRILVSRPPTANEAEYLAAEKRGASQSELDAIAAKT